MILKTFLVSLCLWTLVSQTMCSCPDGWYAHGESCYHFSHDEESLPVAALVCRQMGGSLAEIESAEENTYLTSEAKFLNRHFWIGLTDIQEEGIWRWYGSKRLLSSTGFKYWAPGLPDNVDGKENCAQIRPDGLWGDMTCHTFFFYICEQSVTDIGIVG